jgi:hypothetical protein
VASQLFAWGMSPGKRLYRLSLDRDTRGVPPGEYRIGAEAFVWEDSSPFDNRLDVTQPVVIAPPGGGFPGGGTGERQRDGDGSAVRGIPCRRITPFLFRQPPAFDPDFVRERGGFFPH